MKRLIYFIVIVPAISFGQREITDLGVVYVEDLETTLEIHEDPICSDCPSYNGGYVQLKKDLIALIINNESYVQKHFSTLIRFSIDSTGSPLLSSLNPTYWGNQDLIKDALLKLNNWRPSSDSTIFSMLITDSTSQLYVIVEEPASFPGGLNAFAEYLMYNLRYPATALKMGIEGRVFLQFIVEQDGSITDIQAIKGIGAGCDEEAIRVLSESPKWKPGKQRGRPVRQKMVQNILFKLPEIDLDQEKKKKKKSKKKGF